MSAPRLDARRVSTVAMGVVICGAVVYALGRRAEPTANATPEVAPSVIAPVQPAMATVDGTGLPPGHPPLPVGHPPIGGAGHPPVGAGHPPVGGGNAMGGAPGGAMPAERPEASITWTVPARWQQVPHLSTMRIATYRMPHAPGDAEDPEVSVTRAGGDTEANIARWIGQFDETGRKSAKRTERTVAGFRVAIVEVHGSYQGMSSPEPEPGFAMIGAIVETPGMPHFFKLTGPSKSVDAARAELDALISSVRAK